MKLIHSIKVTFLFFLLSPVAMASLNLNVKIGQVVGNKIIEVNKTIKAEYNKEIVISSSPAAESRWRRCRPPSRRATGPKPVSRSPGAPGPWPGRPPDTA